MFGIVLIDVDYASSESCKSVYPIGKLVGCNKFSAILQCHIFL